MKVTFYRPDDSGQREITGILLGFEDNTLRLLNEAEESLAFDKKQIAVVHAVDQWEEDDETL